MGSASSKGQFADGRGTRAVALVGPAGTGKTSLAEAILYAAGEINRLGSVDAGTSVGDASPEARARGGSTEINLMHFEYLDDHYALVDMPGGVGFEADGLNALFAADIAVVVVDPSPERAALAEPMLRRLDEWEIPHVIFVNKIETARAGAIEELVKALEPMSREPVVLRQIPIREGDHVTGYVDLALERAYRYRPGEPSERIEMPAHIAEREEAERTRLLETLADFDDDLLEVMLTDSRPETKVIMADLAEDTAGNRVVPVVLGSALDCGGVRRLLKLLRHETPSPEQAAGRLHADAMGDAGGLHVFKIANGGAMGRLALGRVLGAPLSEGDELSNGEDAGRAGSIFLVQGDKTAKRGDAAPGDVVAVAKVEGAKAGMLLARKGRARPGEMQSRILAQDLEVELPERNAALAIAALDQRDDVRLSTALHRLCEEDPALEWTQDEASHETVLRGVNDEHLQVVLNRLDRRYGVSVKSRAPRIAYRESIRRSTSQRGRHKKQSGGHGQYGDVVIAIRPLARGEGFVFEDHITGGVIPKQWIPAVETGVRDAMDKGPLGFPVVDVAVTLVDGSFHSVDSSELAFRIAGRMAMLEALAGAGPYLLEPVCRISVDTPQGTAAKAGSLLAARRGQILGMGPHPEWIRWERVEAHVPESALHGLDADMRSVSHGLAKFHAEFDHLAEISGKHADEIMSMRAVA